jgi:hypothetical protein
MEGRPLGKPRHRWEDIIKIDLKEGVGMWTGFAWFRTMALFNTVMNLRIP